MKPVGFVILASLALGLVYTWPLPARLTDSMPYMADPPPGGEQVVFARGDYLQLYYKMWLFQDAVRGGTPFFRDPYKFATERDQPARYSSQVFPASALFALFSVFGTVAAYNLLVWSSYVFAAWAMYLMARALVDEPWAAVVAGLYFALVPFRFVQVAGGHPNGFIAGFAPLVLFFWIRGIRRGRPWIVAAGSLCLVLASMTEIHLVYYTILASPLLVVAVWLDSRRRDESLPADVRRRWPCAAAYAAGCFGGVGYLWFERWVLLSRAVHGGERTYGDAAVYAARWIDVVWRAFDGERTIYLGILGIAAFAAAGVLLLVAMRRGGSVRWRWTLLALAMIGAIGLGLSLGPHLRGYGKLRRFIPMLSRSRVPARASILLFTSAAACLAVAVDAVLGRTPSRRRRAWIVALLLGALVVDFFPWYGIGISRVPPHNAVYEYLGRRPEGRKVLEIPLWPGDSAEESAYLYFVTLSRVPMVNGYRPTQSIPFVRDVYEPLRPLNLGELDALQRERLREIGVTHLILHPEAFPAKVSVYPASYTRDKLRVAPGLREVMFADPVYLFEFDPTVYEDTPPVSTPIGLVFEAEHAHDPTLERARDESASNGSVVVMPPDVVVHLGPGRRLPKGAYRWRLRWRPLGEDGGISFWLIDPEIRPGAPLHMTDVSHGPADSAGYLWAETVLLLERPRLVEDVARATGPEGVVVDGSVVVFADQEDPCAGFEVERVAHIAREVEDPEASGGYAQHAIAGFDPTADLWGNLMRWYPPGRYRATYYLRTENGGPEEVATLRIVQPWEHQVREIALQPVTADETQSRAAYRAVPLEFELTAPSALDFRARFTGAMDLYADRVAVEPVR